MDEAQMYRVFLHYCPPSGKSLFIAAVIIEGLHRKHAAQRAIEHFVTERWIDQQDNFRQDEPVPGIIQFLIDLPDGGSIAAKAFPIDLHIQKFDEGALSRVKRLITERKSS